MTRYLCNLFVCCSLLLGCATNKELEQDIIPEKNAEELFQAANSSMEAGNYNLAIKKLEAMDARYPFGAYAQQTQLFLIYAYYKTDKTVETIAAADRFIRQNPTHANVDYAYYMKGLANFSANFGWLQSLVRPELANRDTSSARQGFNDFNELLKRFPQSKYAEDARLRMIYLRDQLAKHEVYVAQHYMERKAYVAALNRARYVVENYPRTPSVKDAMIIMADAYRQLGMQDLSNKTEQVRSLNN